MAQEHIEIRLVTRAEVSLVWAREASDHELALASYDQHGTDLLIETPSPNAAAVDSPLYGLRAKGFRITLAHAERNVEFQRDPAQLAHLVRQGVLLQLKRGVRGRAARQDAQIARGSFRQAPVLRGTRSRARL
jgi:tyrosine-protein phosphatase YwqE